MVFCDPGEYSSWFSCETCPAGYACPSDFGKYKCGSGEYSGPGWASCEACLPGHYCLNGGINACGPGLFQPNSWATSCFHCDAGFWSGFGATECSSCDAGQYVNQDNSGCIGCAPGTFCKNGFTLPCPAGFFQNEYGKAECKACPIGKYNPRENMETCFETHPGYETRVKASTTQTLCETGTFKSETSGELCTPCNAGHKCHGTGQIRQVKCAAGTFQPEEGKSSCLPCPPKQLCPEEGMSIAKTCPAGLFGTDPKIDACTLCDARFSLDKSVTDREINHGITPCKLIPDGFYLEQNVNLAPCDFDASCFIQEESANTAVKIKCREEKMKFPKHHIFLSDEVFIQRARISLKHAREKSDVEKACFTICRTDENCVGFSYDSTENGINCLLLSLTELK